MEKCILFGVGSYLKSHPELAPQNAEIIGYGYSDPSRATSFSGIKLQGNTIYSIEELVLLTRANSSILVYICSGPWSSKELFLELRKQGISPFIIRFINESYAYGIPWQSFIDEKGNMITFINGHKFISVLNENEGGFDTGITSFNRDSVLDKIRFNSFSSKNNCMQLSCICEKTIEDIQSKIRNAKKEINPKKIYIAFIEEAGLGDSLIVYHFIKTLYERFLGKIIIDFYSHCDSVYKHVDFIKESLPLSKINNFEDIYKYDVVFQGIVAFRIVQWNQEKIKKFSSQLYKYCEYCTFVEKNFFYEKKFSLREYYEYVKLLNKRFIDYPDPLCIISDLSKSSTFIPIVKNQNSILSKFGLKKNEYILLNRGVNQCFPNSPKLWPLSKYNALIKDLKKIYKNINLVQIGIDDNYGVFDNIDLNLLGKTSIDEIKVLLRNAVCLVSGEGGLVHMNHWVKGRSVVIFGPCDIDFFGYDENFNIEGKGCLYKCIYTGKISLEHCPLDYSPPKCMNSVSANSVLKKIDKFIRENYHTGASDRCSLV